MSTWEANIRVFIVFARIYNNYRILYGHSRVCDYLFKTMYGFFKMIQQDTLNIFQLKITITDLLSKRLYKEMKKLSTK